MDPVGSSTSGRGRVMAKVTLQGTDGVGSGSGWQGWS